MYHFDAERVACIAMGVQIYEFGKGEFLTLTQREKPWAVEEGTHGAMIRVKVPANAWDIKLVILKGSPINGLLSLRVRLDLMTGNGLGVLMVKDLEGSDLVTGTNFFFPPEIKKSTDPSTVEWNGIAEIRPDQWFEGAGRFLIPQ
jgi:hypothetical protein